MCTCVCVIYVSSLQDCLYLDIYVPAGATPSSNLPVIVCYILCFLSSSSYGTQVYIHGGG